jgi:hypothetical protein
MENFQVIDLQQQRDFSRKMNATFEFIKQNFASLSKSILIIAGPPVLIGSLLLGSFIGQLFGISSMAASDPAGFQDFFSGTNFWLKLGLMFVFLMISGVITLSTVNNYIMLYAEKKTNKIEVNDVWARVRDTFWMYLGTTFLFVLILIAAYVAMILPIVILAAVSPVLIFFGVILLICGLFWFMISISLIFIIRANEKIGFFPALVRSIKLVQNKWWSTFGLIMILYLIMGVISYIPLIPFYVVLVMNTLHNVNANSFESPSASWQLWTTIFFTVYYMLQTLLNTLPNVGIAFQYYNLVELKEAKGLMTDIDTIGKPQEPNRPEEHF